MEDVELLEKIGSGTYSTVFKCKNKEGFLFASKEIDVKENNHSILEIDIMSRLNHPNILGSIGISVSFSRKNIYINMELATTNLDKLLREKSLNKKEKIKILKDVITGLVYLHSNNIAHLDLKPENILCQINDNGYIGKICDFGLSLYIIEIGVSTSSKRTTYTYRAPEVQKNYNTLNSDVWSLGILIIDVITNFKSFVEISKLPIKKYLHNMYKTDIISKKIDNLQISKDAKCLIHNMTKRKFSNRIKTSEILKLIDENIDQSIFINDNSPGEKIISDISLPSTLEEILIQKCIEYKLHVEVLYYAISICYRAAKYFDCYKDKDEMIKVIESSIVLSYYRYYDEYLEKYDSFTRIEIESYIIYKLKGILFPENPFSFCKKLDDLFIIHDEFFNYKTFIKNDLDHYKKQLSNSKSSIIVKDNVDMNNILVKNYIEAKKAYTV